MSTEIKDPTQEYIDHPSISYSSLSRLAQSPKAYKNRTSPSGEALNLGKAVDILLTEEDIFHDEFYIMTAAKPSSEMMIKYVEAMLEKPDHEYAFEQSGYKKKITEDKWEKEGKSYYDAIKACKGKTVLSYEQYTQCMAVVTQLKTNRYTKRYFIHKSKLPDFIEIKWQFIHYFSYQGNALKVKLDLVVIDHKAKRIIPIDIKTTGKPVMAFKSSYRSYKYYLQGIMYFRGVQNWADEHYPEYTVANFAFLVAEMASYNEPVIFIMSDEDLKTAEEGGTTSTGYEVKGLKQLLYELEQHKNLDMWDYPLEIDLNKGTMMLETMTHNLD